MLLITAANTRLVNAILSILIDWPTAATIKSAVPWLADQKLDHGVR